MNFALLWIDVLLAGLLWTAAGVACAARIRIRWIRIALVLLVVYFPLITFGFFAFVSSIMKFSSYQPDWFGYFFIPLFATFVVAGAVLLRKASRREPGLRSAAATWNRIPLFIAFLIANSIGYMTLLDMDLAIRARCSILSVEVSSLYFASLPAITSESQNAAPIYTKVFQLLQEVPSADVKNAPVGDSEEFNPEEAATLAYLAHHERTIALLRKAATLPGCRNDTNLINPSVSAIGSPYGPSRKAVELLELHARIEAAHGRVASAITDAAAIIQIGQHAGQQPGLGSVVTAFSVSATGLKTLEQILPLVKNSNDLAALHLDDIEFRRMLQQALRSEERFGLLSLTINLNDIGAPKPIFATPGNTMARAFERVFVLNPDRYVRFMEFIQGLAMQPAYQAAPELYHSPITKDWVASAWPVVPALVDDFQNAARCEALNKSAQVAVAVTRYRLDHGSVPSHLSDLVPAYLEGVPLDPFDGRELRFVIKGDQYIVYSIGPDDVDDGGAAMDTIGKGDIAFALSTK